MTIRCCSSPKSSREPFQITTSPSTTVPGRHLGAARRRRRRESGRSGRGPASTTAGSRRRADDDQPVAVPLGLVAAAAGAARAAPGWSRTGLASSTATGPASSGGRPGRPGTDSGTRTACRVGRAPQAPARPRRHPSGRAGRAAAASAASEEEQAVGGQRGAVGEPAVRGSSPAARPRPRTPCRMSASVASRAVGPRSGRWPARRRTPGWTAPARGRDGRGGAARPARMPVSSASSARASSSAEPPTPGAPGALRELPRPPAERVAELLDQPEAVASAGITSAKSGSLDDAVDAGGAVVSLDHGPRAPGSRGSGRPPGCSSSARARAWQSRRCHDRRAMTERKPPGMSFETWVGRPDRRGRMARGDFDGLAGAGKPLPGPRCDETGYEWVLAKARKENLDVFGMLPPALALRKEREDLPAAGRRAGVGGRGPGAGRGLQRPGAGVLASSAGEPVVAGAGPRRRRRAGRGLADRPSGAGGGPSGTRDHRPASAVPALPPHRRSLSVKGRGHARPTALPGTSPGPVTSSASPRCP